MTEDEAAFVEAMGQYLGGYGMTPMAGRLWAWLLICDPPEQTAADLAESLQASRGAISGAAAFLSTVGMIRRVRRRGDRREYFSAPSGTFDSVLRGAGAAYARLVEITEEGLAATAGRSARSRARLLEVHDATVFIRDVLPGLIDQYLRDRAARLDGSARTSPVAAGSPRDERVPA
jgi:DNA-binding transcriptional regulator GbsR (MarR family)